MRNALDREAHPTVWIEVEILHFPVLKEACQSNSVVGQMRLFANNDNVVLPVLRIELEDFLAAHTQHLSVTVRLKSLPSPSPGVSSKLLHKCYSNHAQTHDNDLLPL
jgi:hypothetical protein